MTDSNPAIETWAEAAWRIAEQVRVTAPLIHNITNLVVQNDTAAVIAALGGTQLTIHTPEEAADAAAAAAALAVNIGNLDATLVQSAHQAIGVARARGLPWVLDPVAVGLTRYRKDTAAALLEFAPSVVKGNASEIMVLAGAAVSGRGADTAHRVDEAAAAAVALAERHGCVVVVTGDHDLVTDGTRTVRIANGCPLMGRMIGSGCMLTAATACFLSAARSSFEAAVGAVAYFGVAGELAAARSGGPGTLRVRMIDALDALSAKTFAARVRITG